MVSNGFSPADAELFEHLRFLVGCRTVTVDPGRVPSKLSTHAFGRAFDYIDSVVKGSGRPFHSHSFDVDGRRSLIVGTHPTKSPDIALLIHLDVVDAPQDLFRLRRDPENRNIVIGRGVFDMKFAAAMMIPMLTSLPVEKDPISVAIIFTSDEEKGGEKGTKAIRDWGYMPKLLIIPDGGTWDRLASGYKGAHFISLVTCGKSAHGAYPWLGVNADNLMTRIKLRLLELYPEVVSETDGPTLTIGASHSSIEAPNVIPQLVSAQLDFRYPTNDDEAAFLVQLKQILSDVIAESCQERPSILTAEGNVDALHDTITRRDALLINTGHVDVRRFKVIREHRLGKAMRIGPDMGTNDLSHWPEVPAIITRPLGGDAHTSNEWVDLDSVRDFAQDIMQFIREKNHAASRRAKKRQGPRQTSHEKLSENST